MTTYNLHLDPSASGKLYLNYYSQTDVNSNVNGGNFSIGNANAGAKLDVSGSVRFRGSSTSAVFTTPGQLALKDSTGTATLSFHKNDGTLVGTLTGQNGGGIDLVATGTNSIRFYANTLQRMEIGSAGTVGIGIAPSTTSTTLLRLSGNIDLNTNSLIFADNGVTSIDHIWYNDDAHSVIGGPGTFHFAGDAALKSGGNAVIEAGALYMSDTARTSHFLGKAKIKNALFDGKTTLSLGAGVHVVATLSSADYRVGFFDYVAYYEGNQRGGTFLLSWNGSEVEFTE